MTSVAWSERGHHVAVGSHLGYVTVWDVIANKQVSSFFFFYSAHKNKKMHFLVGFNELCRLTVNYFAVLLYERIYLST